MKEGWKLGTIDSCCTINYGTRVVRKNVSGSKYPVYGGGGETFRMDDFNREDCLVIARFAMSKQCTRNVKGKFFLNDSGLTVEPKKESGLTQSLLDRFLLASNDTIYSFGRGSAQRNLNVDEFRKMPIIYPISLTEQQQIVDFLDAEFAKIDELKNQAEQSLQNAKDLFQAALKEMLTPKEGWKETTIGDLFEVSSSKRVHASDYVKQGVPFYRSKEIIEKSKGVTISTELFISEEQYKNIKDKYGVPQIGDLLLTAVGTIGKIWCVNTNEPFYFKDGNVVRLHAKSMVIPEFFTYLLSHKIEEYKKNIPAGCAYTALTIERLNKLNLFCPSFEEQSRQYKEIRILDNTIQQLQSNYTRTIQLCADLKQALLRQVFE